MTIFYTIGSGETNEDIDAGFIDVMEPVLLGIPTDATVECSAVPTAPEIGTDITATDNLDTDVDIDFSETSTQGLDDACSQFDYTVTRTWTATDDCGNSFTATQIITVKDTSDPIITGVPTDMTVECDAVPAPANPEVSDLCDDEVSISFNEIRTDGNCEGNYTLTRTWIATDACGNETTQTQVIEVEDTTNPILIDVPADVAIECSEVPAPVQPTATDNCDTEVEITFSEVRSDGGCFDSYTLTRTWSATDDCGNEITATQVITVEDVTSPVLIDVPTNITVECDQVPNPAQPTATDNCDTNIEIRLLRLEQMVFVKILID